MLTSDPGSEHDDGKELDDDDMKSSRKIVTQVRCGILEGVVSDVETGVN